MNLVDLNGKLAGGYLVFDCPACRDHKIRVPLAPMQGPNGHSWQHSGEFPALTLTPSVDAGCWHGFVSMGFVSAGVGSKPALGRD